MNPAPDTTRAGDGFLRYAADSRPHGPVLQSDEEALAFADWLWAVHATTPAAEPGATLTRLLAVFRRTRT